MGLHRCVDLWLTGVHISEAAAYEWRLVEEVAEPDAFDAARCQSGRLAAAVGRHDQADSQLPGACAR
jgi:enoyl-CoA hydratase/carnithine racemase